MSDAPVSALKINSIIVDKTIFIREGFSPKSMAEEKISFAVDREKHEVTTRILLSVKVEREKEFVAEVHMSAFVQVDQDVPDRDILLTKNTVAILFPYVRSQMSLITSQPDTIPVMLPAMNINTLVDSLLAKEKQV